MRIIMKHFLLTIAILLAGCQKTLNPTDIDIAEAIENISEEALATSDYFSETEYIPLETNDLSIIGKAPHVVVTKDVFIVSSLQQPLKIFNRHTGKYIGDVGSIGEGPKEYIKGSFGEVYFWVDQSTQNIYVLGVDNNFLVYNNNGHYIDRIKVNPKYNLYSYNFLIEDGEIWGHNVMHTDKEAASIIYIDGKDNNVQEIMTWETDLMPMDDCIDSSFLLGNYVAYGGHLYILKFTDDRKGVSVTGNPSLWKHDGEIKIKQAYNDTIYTLSTSGITPHQTLSLGKWHCDEADRFQMGTDKISVNYILEGNNYLYFHLCQGLYSSKPEEIYSGFYDKSKQQMSLMKGNKMRDLSNNQDLSVRAVTPEGGFCALIQPYHLSDKNKERLNVDDEANPIIVIMK